MNEIDPFQERSLIWSSSSLNEYKNEKARQWTLNNDDEMTK